MSQKDQKKAQETNEQESESHVNRRSFLKRGSIVAGFTTFAGALSLTPFSPVHAATRSTQALPQITMLDSGKAKPYIETVIKSSRYQDFKLNTQKVYPELFSAQEQQASAIRVTLNQDTLIMVRIPVTGGTGNSYYVTAFQPGNLIATMSTSALFSLTSDNNVHAVAERNGQTVLDAVLTPQGDAVNGTLYVEGGSPIILSGLTAKEILHTKITPDTSQSPFCCVLSGLVVYGFVSLDVVLVALVVCLAACVVTVGLACVGCIAAATGVSAGAFGFLEGICNRNPNAINIGLCN